MKPCILIIIHYILDVICIDQSRVRINSGSNFIHASRVPISSDEKNDVIIIVAAVFLN